MTEAVKVRFEPKMMIDGKLVDGQAGTFTNINPATEEPLGEVADASKEDMHRAIDAARRAFDETDWSTNRELRKRCLLQLHEAIESEKEELREELILEVGSPRAITFGPQLDAPLEDGLKYPARLIDEYAWETDLGDKVISLTGTLTTRKVWREPVGVVGAIVPWNFPFEVTLNKLGQALGTGNTVVLKPAPNYPVQRHPAGPADRREDRHPGGRGECRHRLGSLCGRRAHALAQGRSDLVHRVDGGRAADHGKGRGDHEAAVPGAGRQVGHDRPGGRRFRDGLRDRDRAVYARRTGLRQPHPDAAAAVPLRRGGGDPQGHLRERHLRRPAGPRALCGPVISQVQRDRVMGYIRKGVEEGATALVGGPDAPTGFDKGYYVRPTLFTDVDNSMTIAQEEIFGPVLCVIPFDDEEDAIRIANDSKYGLAGNVMSGSLERSLSVARRIRAGFMGVNGGAPYGADTPFGGYKYSGVGRQNGVAGFDQYTEIKSVAYPAG